MKEANILDVYWREVIHIAVYILNRGHERVNSSNNPYDLWYGKHITMNYFSFWKHLSC